MVYLWTGLISLGVSLAATPVLRMVGLKMGVVAEPGEGKVHSAPIPCIGGVGFYLSMLAAFTFLLAFYPDLWSARFEGLVLASTVIVLLGVYDDVVGASAREKLLLQGAVALLVYKYGFAFNAISNPFGGTIELGWLGLVFTVLWFVAIINAINLVDGLDGLAAGIVCIASISLFLIALRDYSVQLCVLTSILIGITLGFLPFNFHPARIFMGDTGAMFLGLVIAAAAVMENLKGTTSVTLLVPLVALGIPILDTLLAVIRRTLSWRHPFRGDMQHLHHRLLVLGLSQRQVVLFIYCVCIYLGSTAFVLSIALPQYTFLVLIILAIGAFLSLSGLRFVRRQVSTHTEDEVSKPG